MTCQNPQWTIRFPQVKGPDGPFEISPREMTLKLERDSYDFCRAEFPIEVGEAMKPHTQNDNGELRFAQHVEVLLDDVPISVLYFRPDFVNYGEQGTYIEFHDLQKSLDSGIVDKEWPSVTLEDAYNYVFNRRTNDLITDIKFTVPDEDMVGRERVDELVGQSTLPYLEPEPDEATPDAIEDIVGAGAEYVHPLKMKELDADATKKLVDSYFAIDFEQVSPETAIWELNSMFNVQTWVDTSRTLWVGIPEAGAVQHLAAPDDHRVWRYNSESVNIHHPRDPIFGVIAEGQWVDEPGAGTLDDVISWFNPNDDDGFGDVRAEGIAYNPEVDPEYGRTIKVKDTDAKRDALPTVARMALYEAMKDQHKGSVGLNPEMSGDKYGPVESLRVGDALRLVPDDRLFDTPTATSGELGDKPDPWNMECGGFVYNEAYLVNGVQHEVSGAEWTMTAHLAMFPDFQVNQFTRYFDPRSGEYVTEDDVFDGDWLSIEDF